MEDRQIYIDKMAAQLKEWDAEIRKMEAKADAAKADLKTDYQQQISELRRKKQEAQKKLTQIQEAGEGAWDELKDGLEQSWKTLESSVKNALAKFRE